MIWEHRKKEVESFLDDIKGMESEAGSIKALIEEYKEKHRNHPEKFCKIAALQDELNILEIQIEEGYRAYEIMKKDSRTPEEIEELREIISIFEKE